MSATVRFLEAMGSKPLSAADYSAAVSALNVSKPEQQALLDRNEVALNSLVGGRDRMYCMIVAADEINDF